MKLSLHSNYKAHLIISRTHSIYSNLLKKTRRSVNCRHFGILTVTCLHMISRLSRFCTLCKSAPCWVKKFKEKPPDCIYHIVHQFVTWFSETRKHFFRVAFNELMIFLVHSMRVFFFFAPPAVPSAPPQLSIASTSPTDIRLMWHPLSSQLSRGAVTRYHIEYGVVDNGQWGGFSCPQRLCEPHDCDSLTSVSFSLQQTTRFPLKSAATRRSSRSESCSPTRPTDWGYQPAPWSALGPPRSGPNTKPWHTTTTVTTSLVSRVRSMFGRSTSCRGQSHIVDGYHLHFLPYSDFRPDWAESQSQNEYAQRDVASLAQPHTGLWVQGVMSWGRARWGD